jgi:UPF0716 family protein affecting phage T7 exclusion
MSNSALSTWLLVVFVFAAGLVLLRSRTLRAAEEDRRRAAEENRK